MKRDKKIKLFANCILVKGYKRSVICDVQRISYEFIPNDLYDLLLNHEGGNIKKIKRFYNNKFDDIIEEYIAYLVQKEFIFFTDQPKLYPKIDLKWFEPFQLSNAIIDCEDYFEIENILFQLDKLKCKFIEFRFFKEISIDLICNILNFLQNISSIISSVTIILPYSEETKIEKLQQIILQNLRLNCFVITGALENKIIEKLGSNHAYVIYTKDVVNSSSHCGVIENVNFAVNVKLFTESQHHNSCLNRKISIDKDGNIKNCPSMVQSFGNIKDTTLEEALNHPDFKKYWNITKDQIEVCKDCEFRHICTDCRAYIEEPNNQYSKPLKCGYNPYTNVWEEWSTNPLKQKAIEYYGMQDLVKKDA